MRIVFRSRFGVRALALGLALSAWSGLTPTSFFFAPTAKAADRVWVQPTYIDPCLTQNFLEAMSSSCPPRPVVRVKPGTFIKVYPFGRLRQDYRAYGMTGVRDRIYFDAIERNYGETRLRRFDPNTIAPPDIANPKLD